MAGPPAAALAPGARRARPAVRRARPHRGRRPVGLVADPAARLRALPAPRPARSASTGATRRTTACSALQQLAATTAGAPTSSSRPVRRPGLRLLAVGERRPLGRRQHRPGADDGRSSAASRSTPRTSSATSATSSSAGCRKSPSPRPATATSSSSTTAATTSASPPPEDPASSAARRELLGLPAAHRRRQPALGLGARERRASPARPAALDAPQRHPQRLGDDRRCSSPALAVVFGRSSCPTCCCRRSSASRLLEVVNYLEHYGLLRQKRRGRPLRALRPRHSWNSNNVASNVLPLPPAAPQRPPRQPDPPLPGAAPLRRGAAAADRLRGDDRRRAGPAAVAAGDGPARARPLRRRRHAGEPRPAAVATAAVGAAARGRNFHVRRGVADGAWPAWLTADVPRASFPCRSASTLVT